MQRNSTTAKNVSYGRVRVSGIHTNAMLNAKYVFTRRHKERFPKLLFPKTLFCNLETPWSNNGFHIFDHSGMSASINHGKFG